MNDIILINAHQNVLGVGGQTLSINIGLSLLAALIKKNGFRVRILRSCTHEVMEWAESVMREEGFRCAGFYCDSENYIHVRHLIKKVKDRWNIPVFAGGPQAYFLDEEFFKKSGCDAVVRGEAEYTLLELLRHYITGEKELSQIAGITFSGGSATLIKNPDRPPITDLDSLPFPDYLMEKSHPQWSGFPVMTGRGCPYRCAFCYEGGMSGGIRFRSVANVIDEIRYHFDRHPKSRYVFFSDDTFTTDPRRVEAISIELAKLRKEKDFIWYCLGHVRPLYKNPELLKIMAESGLGKIFLGIESGNDDILKKYGKLTDVNMIESVVNNAVEAGVPQISGNIIMGGYMSCVESHKKDLDLAERLMRMGPGKVEIGASFLVPYQGTAIRRDPESFGLRLLLEREEHSLTDIPLTETVNMPWERLNAAVLDFNKRIYSLMKKMYLNGEVSRNTIRQHYNMAIKYNFYSGWVMRIFSADTIIDGYYKLLASNFITGSADIAQEEIGSWRPLRVFDICGTLEYKGQEAFINGLKLSELEYDLILRCSGKCRCSDVYRAAREKFMAAVPGEIEFASAFEAAMKKFEDFRWIGYSRF